MNWLDTKQAAEHAHCSRRTLQEAAAAGDLHGFQRKEPKGKWLFRPGCVDAWVMGVPCEHKSNVTSLRSKAS